ncbi:DnaJ domain-containing protein [Heracleum sosnowskyi]|uniref:DnaJ domain-containing protein n=1 Tax=Heracleum sosnowskyi TaxID=360622 RepID=A0AAD8M764_9APIA|nr:DnaJ domain-containing protein [Heracleum sosnowskyi]
MRQSQHKKPYYTLYACCIRRQKCPHASSPQRMNGKGVYGGKTQGFRPRACSGGKTLKSWNRKGKRSNVVVIDVDCDNYDDSEFFRGSGSSGKRKDRNYSYAATVICIDDDDDDDDEEEEEEEEEGYEETIGDNDLGRGWYFRGNSTPFKLSKCKRTYSGKASRSYGDFGIHNKRVFSDDDDDSFDVEFGGSSGKIKQDWEKAFLRRRNECFSTVDQARTSRFFSDGHQDIGTGDKTEKGGGGLDSTNYTSHQEVDRSPSTAMDEGKLENKFCYSGCEASTFDRVVGVCNDQPFTSDLAGPSLNSIDNKHTGEDMKSNEDEDGILVAMDDVVNGQSFGDTNNDPVFFNREMYKETNEYRCSVEAELAARQRELQNQAEEAQHLKRLRKREKAEAMRLLDMERRQKLRVEEMRKTQKKDEENLHLKEQLRAEVRKGLDTLEAACHDMTSILCGLGINVNGVNGLFQVHAAFKRALLSFHPDRSSQSDIRQQVEAEEKFKLVTRMKEKYLSTL